MSSHPGNTISVQPVLASRCRTRMSTSLLFLSWSARCTSVSADNLRRMFVHLFRCCHMQQSAWCTQRHCSVTILFLQNHMKIFPFAWY